MLLKIGRSLFWDLEKDNGKDEKKIIDLTGGLHLERGGFLSAVLGWQMYLNVDGKVSLISKSNHS